MARRSRCSGRSWCSIVATDACKLATCDSSAIVTRSRKRRCTRVLTSARIQVAAAQAPSPSAEAITIARWSCSAASARNFRSSAISASGSAATSASANDTLIRNGSAA